MHGYDWLLISFVPDGSPVKARMLYASTLALLKRELGTSYFSDELHASAPVSVCFCFVFDFYNPDNNGNSLGNILCVCVYLVGFLNAG
jgi:hypothetical protein